MEYLVTCNLKLSGFSYGIACINYIDCHRAKLGQTERGADQIRSTIRVRCNSLFYFLPLYNFSFFLILFALCLPHSFACFDCCWRLIGNISNWFGVNLVMVLDFLVKKYRQKFNPNTFHKNSSSNSFLIPFDAICSCCIRSYS